MTKTQSWMFLLMPSGLLEYGQGERHHQDHLLITTTPQARWVLRAAPFLPHLCLLLGNVF